MKKVLFCTLLFFVFLLSACKNVSTSGVENTQSDSKFAAINFAEPDLSRALSEAYNPLEVTDKDIVKVELIAYGKKTEGSDVSDYEAEIFTSVNDSGSVGKKEWTGESCFTKFKSERLFMFPGTYDFDLNIYTDNINNEPRLTLSAKLENQTLEAGKTSTLKFDAAYAEKGDLSITYEWPMTDRVGKVKMGLFHLDDIQNPVYGYLLQEIPLEEITIDKVPYISSTYTAKDVPNGVYYLKIELYDTNTEKTEVIATYLDLVSIYGYKTTGTKVLDSSDYNQNYFINYHLADDESIMGWEAPDKHNQYQAVILYNGGVVKNPTTGNVRYQFEGWYTDPDFSPDSKIPVGTIGTGDNEEEVQIIALGTELHTKDITLYPKFEQLVLYSINIGGDTPIQPVEEIVVKDKDGTQILDSSEEHSWYDYFKKFEYNVYTVGSKSPFAEITSISRRGYNLRWNVIYERKDGPAGETFLDSLPVSDCGTLVVTDENGETITYNDIISINVAASWISYQTDLNYYFMSEDNSYQQKDILSTTLSDEYNPEEEYKRNSIAELFDGGYVLNKAKSTYNCDAEVHEIVINNYFDKLDSDLAFKAESEGGRTFNFYYTDLTTGDGIFNISKTFTETETGTTSYTAYEYLGIGRYVENKLSLLYLWEYAKRGNSVEATYASIIEDYGQSAAWKKFNELVSSGEPVNGFEQLTVTTDTGAFFNSAITGSTIKYTIDSSSVGTIVHSAFNQNREIGSLIINVSTDNLSGYTNENPAYLNQKPSLTFGLKHADGTDMASDDFISLNINLMQNNTLIESWNDKKPSDIYLYVNDENYDSHDPDAKLLNPANATQTIYLKSLPNAGTYQLYINVSYGYSDGMEYSGSYSTSFVTNDTFKYEIDNDSLETDFTVKNDLKNAKGIVNVIISGENNKWGSQVPSFISEALSDGFDSIGDFFVNLDLSGLDGIEEFSGLVNEKNGTPGTDGKLLTLKLPSRTTKIASDAVKGFGKLYTIELPASVSDIASDAFEGSGRKFILDENNKTFKLDSNDTVILDKAGTNLYAYAGGSGKLIIPDGVTSLPSEFDTSNVVSLYVPDTIEDIQSLDTTYIQELSINASKTSVSTTGTLTATLPNLQKLTLRGDYTSENDFVAPTFQSGDSPTYPVGKNVAKLLAYCADTLTDLTFDGDVVIPETKFSNPKSYSEYNDWCVNFFTRFTQKDSDGYEVSETKLKSLTFNGAATIGKQAFYDCRELEYVSPNVKTLNLTAFASEGVTIEFNGDSPKTIGEEAFGQYRSDSVKFDHIKLQGVTSIGKEAFAPLNLAGDNPYIEFSDSLIKLGPRAFGGNFSDVSKLKGIDYSVWYTTNDPAVWSSYEGLAETVLRKQTTYYTRQTYDSLSDLLTVINDSNNYLVRPVSN